VSGPDNISKVDRLRLRDGGRCWLCDEPLEFKAVPNSKTAPTLEHLIAQSRGGPSTLDNLVLCHPRCNNLLGDRPLADKIKMRERRRKKHWIATLRPQ
jgi:5-methylcytosine-specific restriction endonuclease McrA